MALDSFDCELCLLFKEEKPGHLFFKCPFVKNCWNRIGVTPPTWLKPDRAARHIKSSLKVPFAMDFIILMFWSIWTQINAWLFNHYTPRDIFQKRIWPCYSTVKKEMDIRDGTMDQ
jgi:hypothetical protein